MGRRKQLYKFFAVVMAVITPSILLAAPFLTCDPYVPIGNESISVVEIQYTLNGTVVTQTGTYTVVGNRIQLYDFNGSTAGMLDIKAHWGFASGLGIGSTKTAVATGAWLFSINSVDYGKSVDAVGVAPGNDVIPSGKYGAVAFEIGTDLVVHSLEAADNAAGYDEAILAVGGLPYQTPSLTIGSTLTNVSHRAFVYYIGGTQYTKAANAVGISPGDDVIPTGKLGAVAFDIGTDGTIHVIEATNNATGYDDSTAAIADLPAVASNHFRIGCFLVSKSDGDFTFGTTELSATNVTYYSVEYFDHYRLGYVTASKSDGDFTFGTTLLDAENTTVAYSPSAYTWWSAYGTYPGSLSLGTGGSVGISSTGGSLTLR